MLYLILNESNVDDHVLKGTASENCPHAVPYGGSVLKSISCSPDRARSGRLRAHHAQLLLSSASIR